MYKCNLKCGCEYIKNVKKYKVKNSIRNTYKNFDKNFDEKLQRNFDKNMKKFFAIKIEFVNNIIICDQNSSSHLL